jgi:hypothetical protein
MTMRSTAGSVDEYVGRFPLETQKLLERRLRTMSSRT